MTELAGRMVWRSAWLVVVVAGMLLIGLMVTAEGEPGALPLAMVLAGAVGLAATWRTRPRS